MVLKISCWMAKSRWLCYKFISFAHYSLQETKSNWKDKVEWWFLVKNYLDAPNILTYMITLLSLSFLKLHFIAKFKF